MNVKFLQEVLPKDLADQDLYFFIARQPKDKSQFKQSRFLIKDIYEHPEKITKLYDENMNMYFTPVVYDGDKRIKRYARYSQALIVDYDDKPELDDFLRHVISIGIPQPSYVVDTGRGYHLWWLLKAPIDVSTYEKLNRKLTQLLEADTNAVKITHPYRIPDTWNVKHSVPMKAKIVVDIGERYDVGDFDFDSPLVIEEEENVVDVSDLSSVLSPYYVKGQRHQLILGLAGFLNKLGYSESDAVEIVKQIIEELGDDEVEDRLRIVRDTYRKENIAGASILSAISVELPQKLRKILKPAPDDIYEDVRDLYIVGKDMTEDKVYSVIYNKRTGKTIKLNMLDQRLIRLRLVLGLSEKDADKLKKIRDWIVDETVEAEELSQENTIGKGYWLVDNTVMYNGEISLMLDETDVWQVYYPPYYKKYILDRDNNLVKGADEETIFSLHNTHLREYKLQDTEMVRFLKQFNWKNGIEDVYLLTAIIYTALIGKQVNDRFLVYVYGNKGYGKSTVFRYLYNLTQGLTVSIKNASEFARYKILSTNQVIPLYDDFEPNYKRNFEVIDLWKDNTQGMAVMLRGTKSQGLKEYKVFHIPFFNSINFTISDEAVASRIIAFRLEKPNAGKYLDEPNDIQAFIENSNIIAITLRELKDIKRYSRDIISKIIPPHERLNNMLLVPVGILLRFGIDEETVLNIVQRLWNQHLGLVEEYSVETQFWDKFFRSKPDYRSPYVEDLLEGAIVHDNYAYSEVLAENGVLVSEDKEVYLIQKARRLVKDDIVLTKEAFKRILERFPEIQGQKISLMHGQRKSVRQAWEITELVYKYLADSGISVGEN